MPNKPSAKKALRQSKKRYIYNLRIKRGIKDAIKEVRRKIKDKPAEAGDLIKKAVILLDRTAQKGVIKKNNAARRKSRLWVALSKTKNSAVKK